MGCTLRVSHHTKTIFLIKISNCKNANEGTRFQKLSHTFRRLPYFVYSVRLQMIQILLRSLVWLMNLAYRTQFASNECSEPRVLLKEVYNMRFDVNFTLLSWKQLEVILVIQRQFLLNDRHFRYVKSRILIDWKALTFMEIITLKGFRVFTNTWFRRYEMIFHSVPLSLIFFCPQTIYQLKRYINCFVKLAS